VTTIVAVRHGETAWNREGRMQGWAPVPLNDRGCEQAAAAGRWLAREYDVDRVHASDLLRTRQTVDELLAHLGLDESRVSYEPAWRERDVGVYQGLSYEDVEDRFPDFGLSEPAADAAHRTPESGESLADVSERVGERFEELLRACAPDETRLVVAHGGPIYMLLGHVKDVDVASAVLDHHQDNCGVTAFEHDPETGETRVDCENLTEWRATEDAIEADWDSAE
jgi:probable phosphoglycerate mutase